MLKINPPFTRGNMPSDQMFRAARDTFDRIRRREVEAAGKEPPTDRIERIRQLTEHETEFPAYTVRFLLECIDNQKGQSMAETEAVNESIDVRAWLNTTSFQEEADKKAATAVVETLESLVGVGNVRWRQVLMALYRRAFVDGARQIVADHQPQNG